MNLHCRVFDRNTHYLLLLGRPIIVSAYHWYCESPSAFVVVAENGQGTVGCATVNIGSYYAFFRKNWARIARAFVGDPKTLFHPLVLHRLASLLNPRRSKCQKALRGRSAYLGYLVVDGSTRGKGIGGALIRAAIENCRARGWDQLVTCLHRTNLSAYSFYQTLGFERFPQLDSDDLIGIRISTAGPRQNSKELKKTEAAQTLAN